MILRLDSSLKPSVRTEATQENLKIHKLSERNTDNSDRCFIVSTFAMNVCRVVMLYSYFSSPRSIIMSVVSFCEMEGSQ